VTLFNEEPKTEGSNEDNNPNAALQQYANTLAEKLVAIKRDDGTPKYESVEQALDALLHSQTHIRTLEGENSELKTTASKITELEQALQRLQGSAPNKEQPTPKTEGNSGGLSEEAAREIARREFGAIRQTEAAMDNLKSVNQQLINKYGSEEKAREAVKLKAVELDMSLKEFEELSKVKPKAVLAYFGGGSATPISTNSSTVRVPNTPPSETVTRPEKSLLSGPGATGKNQVDYLQRIRENVMKKLERGELT
jgi:hypothetical protein